MDLALSQSQQHSLALAAALTGACRTYLFAASDAGPVLLFGVRADGDGPQTAPGATPETLLDERGACLVHGVFHTHEPADAPDARCIPLLLDRRLLGALYQEVHGPAVQPPSAVALDALAAQALALLEIVHSRPLAASDPSPGALYSTEIAELKRAKRALQASEARWRSLIENAPASVYAVDRAGKLVFLNRTSTNADPAAYIGMPAEMFILPAELPSFRRTVQHIFATGETVRSESPIKMLDGRVAWFDHRCAPIVEEGEITGIIFVSTDITPRKQAEEELRRARELAEQAYRAKHAFLTNMTHELRTPLSILLGFAQLLGGLSHLDEEQLHGLHAIIRSGEHLQSLIEDTLELALLEAGEITAREERLELAALLDEMHERFSRRAAEHGLAWQVEVDPATPAVVYADADKLRRALVHLLDNAFRYTAGGRAGLRVSALPLGPDEREEHTVSPLADCRLCLEVIDTGPGLDAAQLARIFEPFSRSAEAGRWGEGSGLGLPISRHLSLLLGGSLSVVTRPGQGSTFSLVIPVRTASGKTAHTFSAHLPAGEPLSPPRPHSTPDGWRSRLRRAAVEADIAGLHALADELAASDADNLAAAETIRRWAEDFDYSAIVSYSELGQS